MRERTDAGLFLGWKVEAGFRYKGVLRILDYEAARVGRFTRVRNVYSEEVYFPDDICFPFAEARTLALRTMQDKNSLGELPDLEPPLALPWDSGDKDPVRRREVTLGPAPRFQITKERIFKHEGTPGCQACLHIEARGRTHTHLNAEPVLGVY